MNIITAPQPIVLEYPSVFLAGGITDCPWWQDEVIRELVFCGGSGTVLNPRRRDFPIHDPNAALEQITWEYHALNAVDIFSMWFSAGDSVQPICMYELGRHLAIRRMTGHLKLVVIGVEPGYKRIQDVYIQTGLISKEIKIADSLDTHIWNIIEMMAEI